MKQLPSLLSALRQRCRFHLSTLFLVTLFVAVLSGLYMYFFEATLTIHRIRRLGGDVSPWLTPSGDSREPRRLCEIQSVYLLNTKVTDSDLEVLRPIHQTLYTLYLSSPNITLDCLTRLEDLPSLNSLHLEGKQVDDRWLAAIGAKLPRLSYLAVGNTSITDDGMRYCTQMPKLRTLKVDGTRVSDRGILALRASRTLGFVSVSRTAITDASVGAFTEMRSLRGVCVRETAISADAIRRLRNDAHLNVWSSMDE